MCWVYLFDWSQVAFACCFIFFRHSVRSFVALLSSHRSASMCVVDSAKVLFGYRVSFSIYQALERERDSLYFINQWNLHNSVEYRVFGHMRKKRSSDIKVLGSVCLCCCYSASIFAHHVPFDNTYKTLSYACLKRKKKKQKKINPHKLRSGTSLKTYWSNNKRLSKIFAR